MNNTTVTDYKQLIAWQKAMKLCLFVYKITAKYPKFELYSLTDQTRRSAISVPSNIAEGNGRSKKTAEYRHFLQIAYGSALELETQIIIAHQLKYITDDENELFSKGLLEVLKLLQNYISRN